MFDDTFEAVLFNLSKAKIKCLFADDSEFAFCISQLKHML